MLFENNERMKSPEKTLDDFNIFKEETEKDKQIIKSPSSYYINNHSFCSPSSKSKTKTKAKTNNISNNNNWQKDKISDDYSPYVKRITISDGKNGENKIDIIKEIMHNKSYFTSYKKISRRIYLPSPYMNDSHEKLSDRFIPFNKGINLLDKFNLTTKCNEADENNCENITINYEERNNKDLYNKFLKNIFLKEYKNLSTDIKNNNNRDISKLFSYKQEKPKNLKNFLYDLKSYQEMINNNNYRKISPKPYKVLSAPNILDDFYLNLLDWSSKNQIAVASSSSVILWNMNKTQSKELFTYKNNQNNTINKYVSSLIFSEDGDQLAVGNSCGYVELYDINKEKKICSFKGHSARVGVVSWNKNILSSGSKDFSIITRDIRCKNDDENIIRKFYGHNQEVCGLKWSFDGSQLASGGNDNKLILWSLHSKKPLMCNNDHLAAVKAIAWSPRHHNVLVSGGGSADRTIRFWNANTFEQISKIDTGSQVCNLVFSKSSDELVSTHGYSLNHIIVWKLPNMEKIATLSGHSCRVLYLSLSPDGQNIVTGAGDKILQFWKVFPPFKNYYKSKLFPSNNDCR
jgi:cell division cycle 20-like protein 1 (cofactor of APC complex)